MTAVTAFSPTGFNIFAFQIDPFGYPRRGGSTGGKTRRKRRDELYADFKKRQDEIYEAERLAREAVRPKLAEAAKLVEALHGEEIAPRIENAERLLEYLTKPFAVYTSPVSEKKADAAPVREPVPLSLDAMLAVSPTIDALTGGVEVEVAGRPPTPEQIADIVEAIEAFLDSEES